MIRILCAASILAAIAGAPASAECKFDKVSVVKPVIANDQLYLPSKINDKPVLFLIDTGSLQTALFREAATALGLNITAYGATLYANSGGGNPSKTSGGTSAMGAETEPTSYRAAIVGLLGEDLLSHFDVEFDVKGGRFILYQVQGCESDNLAYWSKDYDVADMTRYDPKEPRVLMSGKLNDSPTLIQIASGMSFTAVSSTAADARGVSADGPDAKELGTVPGLQGEPTRAWLGTFANFSLDEEKTGQAKIAFLKFPRAKEANIERGSRLAKADVTTAEMALGFDFLQAHHVLISHSQKKVYFSYLGGAPFAAPVPRTADWSK